MLLSALIYGKQEFIISDSRAWRLFLFFVLSYLALTCTFSSLHAFQTGSLLLTLYFIRTRLNAATHIQTARPSRQHQRMVLYKGLSLSVFPLDSANDACRTRFLFFFYIDTPCSTPLIDTLNLLPPSPTPLFPLLLSSLTSTVFVWLLGFVCLLFPDGRRRLHLSSFQVPREIFTALAQALILFPLAGLYDGPFIRSNWKQLSLPVWVRKKDRKFRVFFPPPVLPV